MIEKDPNDECDAIFEIKGAAGGDEGNIFAGDLYRMYSRYAETKGWQVQTFDFVECELVALVIFHLLSKVRTFIANLNLRVAFIVFNVCRKLKPAEGFTLQQRQY